MRDRDIELIAALAEGSLEDETEARALIASSEEHLLEYEAQKQAIEALGSVEPARMTDVEKAALHRDVWTEVTSSTTSKTKTPWYYRLAPVAASLFVVVGIGAVLTQNGDSDSADPVDLVAESNTTVAAGDTTGEDGAEQGFDSGEGAAAPTARIDNYALYAQELKSGSFNSALDASGDEDIELQSCIDRIEELDGYVSLGVVPTPSELEDDEDLRLIAALPVDADLTDGPLAFVDADRCEIVYLED